MTATFEDNDRVGLIGQNGAGKSTLLKLINGELKGDGILSLKGGLRIGYLKQNAGLDGERNVYDEMLDAFSGVFKAEDRMREIEGELKKYDAESVEYKSLLDEHKRLDDYHASRDGYNVEYRIKYVLNSMGFRDAYEKPVSVLSGGERTRLALAKLLLSDLELLMLDEPTNHLDVSTMLWLEGYLNEKYKGALLIVSHDRYFLDKTVNKIYELEEGKITVFRGNYTKYKQLKSERLYSDSRLYEKQQKQVAEMLEYAERNIARASTSKSAKSRLHRVANMDLIDKPFVQTKEPVFKFEIINECNKNVLSVNGLNLVAGEKTLVENLSFEVFNCDRLAIVGANGIGKSTLVKTLLGFINAETDHYNPVPNIQSSAGGTRSSVERQCNGAITYGKNLRISYYDQENLNLSPENTVLEELWYRFPLMEQTAARSVLAKMLFTAEDMDKTVASLSGGERAKLAFAIVLAEKSNLLVFDEPTNHLDLSAREALEEGLKSFAGTLIYVSHDRYFMDATATKILELSEDSGKLYKGNYSAYLVTKERESAPKTKEEPIKTAKPEVKPANTFFRTKEDRRQKAQRDLLIKELERKIEETENQIAALNEELITGTDYKNMPNIYAEIERLQADLDDYYAKWEEAQE